MQNSSNQHSVPIEYLTILTCFVDVFVDIQFLIVFYKHLI